MKKRRYSKCPKDARAYRQLWRVVDGAVADAFHHHPDYLTKSGHRSAQNSITKRVTGAVIGFAAQAARAAPGEIEPAADREIIPAKDISRASCFGSRIAALVDLWGRAFSWSVK